MIRQGRQLGKNILRCVLNLCFRIRVLHMGLADELCKCFLQLRIAVHVLQIQHPRSRSRCKAQEVLTDVKAQEVLTDVNAQEVLTDSKTKKSQQM